MSTNLNLVSLDAVAELAAEDLPDEGLSGEDVSAIIDVGTEGASNVVSIAATDPAPELAARVADSFAESYVKFRRRADRRKIANAVALVKRQYDALGSTGRRSDEGQTLQKQVGRLQAQGSPDW